MQHTLQYRLGIPQLTRYQMVREIAERIRCARLWCQRYWKLLCNPDLRCRAKFQLYKFFVRPILTYGCELWDLDEQNSKKLMRFECALLVEIYKSKYPQRHPNRLKPNIRAIYSRYRGGDIVKHVNNERLRWSMLLRGEEMALRTPRRRLRHLVHFWDQHPPSENVQPSQDPTATPANKSNNPNANTDNENSNPYVDPKTCESKDSLRTRSMDDAPG